MRYPLSKKQTALSIAIACSATEYTYGQTEQEFLNEKPVTETVVVIGSTTNTHIITEDLELQQADDLSDIFRHLPSVSVGGSLGIAQKIYIRGMEDTLLNVTVDGAPQTGTLFHHTGRVSIEPELLERIEVQAGAGEATSGAGAIGGTVRFKTKSAEDLLTSGRNVGALVKGNAFSNNGTKFSGTVFGRLSNSVSGMFSYVDINRDNMKDGDGNTLYGTASDQNVLFAKMNSRFGEHQNLTVSYEKRNEEGEFNQRPNWDLEGSTLMPIEGDRETLVINHTVSSSNWLNLESTAYRTEQNLLQNVFTRWGRYQANIESLGFDVRNTINTTQHTITYGVDYRQDTVTSGSLENGENGNSVSEEGDVLGIYIQDHWRIVDSVLMSFGVRLDDYDLEQVTLGGQTNSDGISPNIGLEWTVIDGLSINVGVARALRGKEVGDGFTIEEATIASNLQPEEVQNNELGIEYKNESLALTAAYYKSRINDVIMDQVGQGTVHENVGELETQGIEFTAAYQWDNLYIAASYSTNESELNGNTVEGYEHNGLANERGDTWSLNIAYTLSQLEFGWHYTRVEDLNNIEVLHRAQSIGWTTQTYFIDKPGYNIHDLYVQWSPAYEDSLVFSLAVQNAFNELYRDHSSVADYASVPKWGVSGLMEPGRDVRFTVKYQF